MGKPIVQRASEVEIHGGRNTAIDDAEMASLAIAWLNGDVTITQASVAIFGNRGNRTGAVQRMAMSLRREILAGRALAGPRHSPRALPARASGLSDEG